MASLAPRRLPLRPYLSTRAFSTTPSRSSSLHIEKNDPELVADTVPAYPYGPRQWYKQSNKGLYGTTQIQFGNNIGPKFKTKTRRTWHPNVVRKRLWSHALGRSVQIKVQARVLRTIDKVGGLDEYLLGDKEGRIKDLGVTGWWLRWAIMQTPHIKARFSLEREILGVPAEGIETSIEELETTPEGEALVASKGQSNPLLITTRRSATFRQARLLKFRVDRGAHFVFTSKGWRRAVPDKRVRGRRKVLLRSPALRNFAVNYMKRLDAPATEKVELVRDPVQATSSREGEPLRIENTNNLLQQVLQEQGTELTPEEEKAVRKEVTKALRAKQERLVEKRVDRPEKLAAERKAKDWKARIARSQRRQKARDGRREERAERVRAARMS